MKMISRLLSFIRTFVNETGRHGWKIFYFVINSIYVVAASNNLQIYKQMDCLVGDRVLAIFVAQSRGQCAFYCSGQSGSGFSYVSESRKCTIFKQMFIDQSKCGMSANIYGSIDTCDTWAYLRDFRGNYTVRRPFMGDVSVVRYRCNAFNHRNQVDYCPISRCNVFWTPASLSCSENDIFDINSLQHEGKVSCTVKGVKCQRWDSNTPHQPLYFSDRSDLHNWCQRTTIHLRPWCYTTDPETTWDYCPVEERLVCGSPPSITISMINVTLRRPYKDMLSVGRYRCETLEDKEPEESCPVTRCLSSGYWSTANISCSDKECYDPVDLTYNGRVTCTWSGITCQRWDSNYPHPEAIAYGHSDLENRCAMAGEKKPWCFTMHPDIQWQWCPVDKCA